MTITEDIVAWAKTRPLWQQRLLQVIAAGESVTDEVLQDAVTAITQPSTVKGAAPLDVALPAASVEKLSLVALKDCKGVNALAPDNVLEFAANGLTVIYGDNGSGKSGYARLLKDMVGARHPATVLPNVFDDPAVQPSATLHYAVDGDENQQKYPGPTDANVKKMAFYDEHCGDVYLSKRSTLTYRPSALTLLDGLILACDQLRDMLSSRLQQNQAKALQLAIPPETAAGVFVSSLKPTTSQQDIVDATSLPADIAQRHARAASEVARLQSSDAVRERQRLERLSAAYTDVADFIDVLDLSLGATALTTAATERTTAQSLRQAAALAASADFSQELPGVGGETWRALWAAARNYSVTDAYPSHEFPATHDGARCVLCQQSLDADAADRLRRFDQFMVDTTQRDAARAETVLTRRQQGLSALVTEPVPIVGHLALLDADLPDVAAAVRAVLADAEAVRLATASWLAGDTTEAPMAFASGTIRDTLAARALALKETAGSIDVASFQSALAEAQGALRELEASMLLAESVELLKTEVTRLQQAKTLQSALDAVSTMPITTKSSQLTRLYASDVIKDRFIRETEQLHLRRVTMKDLGGKKGQLEQQPSLLGAKASGVSTMSVLSEGEQTALGLAGFFTEAEFDSSKSALILDDPVTSLDHVRREHVARRLAELAADRQVVVFTHDVVFAGELLKQAERLSVPVAQRAIERQGTVPGHVQTTLPWKAKDFKSRYADLDVRLQKMTKTRADFTQEDWEEAVASWAGRLSELWERAVTSEVLDEVYDRGTSEVRVMKFRVVAAVTDADNDDFQSGYGACSKWARRHDKAPETNFVAPETDELRAELDRIKDWQSRMKKYRS
jgi:energy-coupling factor transporter ATP-binding protein EcfA2